MMPQHFQEVRETDEAEAANRLLAEGWALLGVFQRAEVCDGRLLCWALYVLGRGEAGQGVEAIEHVEEVAKDAANKALAEGAVLMRVITRKADEEEYPRF
ncbi:MAG TPA: hypothetical protein PK490_22085, partial [Prosthecobacter sp.]|nr:hypothetical protein [Prosthecobacter sp.]